MPEFAYIARDMSGKKTTGTVAAGNQREAIALLDAKSLFPIEVTVNKATVVRSSGRVRGLTMAVFYSQLAALLRSGVPMLRGLTVLGKQSTNKTLTNVLEDVRGRVEEGESLGAAMARFPKVFSEMAVNMVKAGAEGGFLEDALERVATFTEQQEDLKGRTLGALAYPAFLASVGTVVLTVLMVFFVPKFEPLFANLRRKGQLPAMTEWLLAFSRMLQAYWWVGLLVIVVGLFALVRYISTERGRRNFDLVKIKLPMIGKIFLNLAVARFCRVFGTLLVNGVPILRSLEISRESAGNVILTESIAKASENITAGERLAVPLGASGHFPPTVVEMVSIAEESNTLDHVLVQIADGLEKRTFRQLDLFVKLLEPVMLLGLAAVVMFVVLALMVPVLNSANSI
jgi:general secretion pathway protein F/type IV pilus assembly protein PilC